MEDSSPDLSLKLRRGSSDSRDSFYMDFAQGIDSDIEEMGTTSATEGTMGAAVVICAPQLPSDTVPALGQSPSPSLRPPRPPDHALTLHRLSGSVGIESGTWSGMKMVDPLLPSPSSPAAIIVSPETLSHHSSHSPLRPPTRSTLQMRPAPQVSTTAFALAVATPAPLHARTLRRASRAERQLTWRQLGTDALATTLSALYGKLLVVMGTAFPMAEVISTYIPPSFYDVYYLYLYIGSMFFLLYMYTMLLVDKRRRRREMARQRRDAQATDETRKASVVGEKAQVSSSEENSSNTSSTTSSTSSTTSSTSSETEHVYVTPSQLNALQPPKQYHYGSFYLRMGAVAFGIGSMIYSGLEFGQYFELERNTKCHNVLLALTPATRMAFIFIQMYFIFLNNEQMRVYKHKYVARFGLMHMIGTNLSVWLNVLVQETKHEILTFYNPENNTLRISHRLGTKGNHLVSNPSSSSGTEHLSSHHHIVTRGLKGPHLLYECRRTNIIGSLVQDASPFLFPCTIEYSLICAAILYMMWKNISKLPQIQTKQHLQQLYEQQQQLKQQPTSLVVPECTHHSHSHHHKRSPHHYSVDCARAHKGLFVGILILVLTIISLILFFVLISRAEFVSLAVMEVNICELTLYGMSTLATLIGMIQVRQLKYDGGRNLQLDNILLVGAQTGMFIYSTFTIIGGQFTIEKNTVLVLATALASLLQTTCQTIFVLDASRRSCSTPEQIRRKPGREIVTFLLVTNLAMWAINTLEKSRAESHPIQLHFYGLWAWTIITHVSMPLAIFYRFHSTVCLCEIWKRAYKMKPTYM